MYSLILTITVAFSSSTGAAASSTMHTITIPEEKTCQTAAEKWLAEMKGIDTSRARYSAVCVLVKK